jgi:chemotaxis protein methyltransferase WspC
MGLDAASIGASVVERVVAERQRASGMGPAAYFDHVSSSPAELQRLIEAVVVPETWFFRDGETFEALVAVVRALLADEGPARTARFVSLPCSSGEEPYSIAMALLDARIPVRRFRIDAVDISAAALARARRGTYGKGSFRGGQLTFRDRYFEAVDSGYEINQVVRASVEFRQANLFDAGLSASAGRYDVVFCRNLLIYFDAPTQQRATEVLERLLAPGGVLFVGAAESPVLMAHGFVPLDRRRAHGFRRRDAVSAPPLPAPASTKVVRRPDPVPQPPARPAAPPAVSVPAVAVPAVAADRLDEGLRLANEGRLAEAASCCEAHIQRHGPSARAYHVLGLVRDACGQHADAAACYRKALYLDPGHEEALVHLALLLEAQDNETEARLLRSRAQRIAEARG